jgi:hypothetical protein
LLYVNKFSSWLFSTHWIHDFIGSFYIRFMRYNSDYYSMAMCAWFYMTFTTVFILHWCKFGICTGMYNRLNCLQLCYKDPQGFTYPSRKFTKSNLHSMMRVKINFVKTIKLNRPKPIRLSLQTKYDYTLLPLSSQI